MFILKLVGKVLLIPVWLLLAAACVLVTAVVNIAGVIKGMLSLLLGTVFVLSLIWFYGDWMRFILLGNSRDNYIYSIVHWRRD